MAAFQALACYSPADLESAELLRPLRQYAELLMEETDSFAQSQAALLLQEILKYEYTVRRRFVPLCMDRAP